MANDGVYVSRSQEEIRYSTPARAPQRRRPSHDVLRVNPGPTPHANRRVDAIESCFMKAYIFQLIITWANKEGQLVYADRWFDIDEDELSCFIVLLINAGAVKGRNEAIMQLRNPQDGRPIFGQSMPRRGFKQICRILRFDDSQSRR